MYKTLKTTDRFKTSVKQWLLACPLFLGLLSPSFGDVVLDWNSLASDVLVANTELQNPGMASRSMAMMNLAIYDSFAMTSSNGKMFYDYGAGHDSPGYTASTTATAAQAAYTVLSGVYGDQQGMLDSQLNLTLSGVANGAAKTEGISLGTMIGQQILASRANDGYNTNGQYMPTNQPGHWQSDPLNPGQEAWGPSWGSVTPFAMNSPTQFTAPAMPDLASQQYADAYNEVKVLGDVNRYLDNPQDTVVQEHLEIGNFWAYDRVGMGTPMRMFNSILRTISDQEGNTQEENAALFAKATVAMADAGIAAWNSKFDYDFWRPVTGIRDGDLDGNPLTEADTEWTPLGAPGGDENNFTPPFPTYVSGHATFGGALFQVLANHYETDNIAFTLSSEELDGVERDFLSFSEAMAENGRSRVYLGIHWNFDDTVGQELGSQIADYLFSTPFIAPVAVPEPASVLVLSSLALFAASRRRRC